VSPAAGQQLYVVVCVEIVTTDLGFFDSLIRGQIEASRPKGGLSIGLWIRGFKTPLPPGRALENLETSLY
jgi:hypothetical protein